MTTIIFVTNILPYTLIYFFNSSVMIGHLIIIIIIILTNLMLSNTNKFSKERYNTYAKSCNSNLYTKYPSAISIGLLLVTMCCYKQLVYNVNSYQTIHF